MKLTYRPEIDGLRAIAVGAVILYHAQINIFGHQLFKGGFIGVDIFFVISGYLITSIIFKELVITGSFSFKHFYERRIRRILPALLFVMLVSLPFAWIYLLPSSFIDFSKSILYSLGFTSNFYFWYSGQQYGAQSGLLKPFLHTWSLSVEEQFYILFPIILLITFKYFKKYLIHILILGFAISLGLADWGSRNHPSFNFYVLPTRGWELLAGSILAYFEIALGHRSKNIKLNLTLPSIGLLLIGHSILFFNDKMFHPSFYTISPIVGVSFIIWFSNKNEPITKILSTKLFVGIGLISYSLYLWHYPIFAFQRINSPYLIRPSVISFLNNHLNYENYLILEKITILLFLIVLSIFSFYFVEKIFRNKKNNFKILFKFVTIFFLILVITNYIIIKKKGYINRFANKTDLDFKFKFYPTPYTQLKLNSVPCLNISDGCLFNTLSNKKFFIFGDSLAASLAFNLHYRLTKKNFQFIYLNKNFECFTLIDTEKCKDGYLKLNNSFFDEKNSIFVVAASYKLLFNDLDKQNIDKDLFTKNIRELSKNNQIIIVYPFPTVNYDPIKKLYDILKKQKFDDDLLINKNFLTTSYKEYMNKNKSVFDILDTLENENIYRVYPHKLFCDTIIRYKCLIHNNNDIFYSDSTHPSLKGAEMINDLIMKEIEKIELKSK